MTSSERLPQIPEFSKGDIVLWSESIYHGGPSTGEVVEVQHLGLLDHYLYRVLWDEHKEQGPEKVDAMYLTPTQFPDGVAYCQVFVMDGKNTQFFGAFARQELAQQSADFRNTSFARIKEGEPMHGSHVIIVQRKVPEEGIVPLYLEMTNNPSARDEE